MIAADKLTGNDVVGNVTVYLLMAYCLFVLISVGYAVDLQLEKRRVAQAATATARAGRPEPCGQAAAAAAVIQLFPMSAVMRPAPTCEQTARGRTGAGRGHRLTSGSLTYRWYACSNSGEPGASI